MHHQSPMDRRSLIQRALLIVAGSAIPVDAAARQAGAAMRSGEFKLLSAVADTIVPRTDTPGAVDVGVPKLFDGLLRDWAAPPRRAALAAALEAVDAAAREKTGKGFAALPPGARHDVLKAHDAAALAPVPRTDGKTGLAAVTGDPSVADPGYAKLKELVVILYYYSEPALTQELSYDHAPGKWQPSIPVTPDTRPAGGPGLI